MNAPWLVERARAAWDALSRQVYPRACVQCGEREGTIASQFCGDCWETLPKLFQNGCVTCAFPHGLNAEGICARCLLDPPAFSCAFVPFRYEGAAEKAVLQLKFHQKTLLARPMARAMAEMLMGQRIHAIVAIPLHRSRLRVREYNQAFLLAAELSTLCAWPLYINELIRVRPTRPQVGFSQADRACNIADAFHVRHTARIQGLRLLLVDDVYTSGATLREGAKTLKQAGATQIVVAAFARAMLHSIGSRWPVRKP